MTSALPQLQHGREKWMYGDNAYRWQKALIRAKAPQANDFTNERVRRRKDEPADDVSGVKSRTKSKGRTKVEPVFAVVKRLWGYTKVRYRGLVKRANRAFPESGCHEQPRRS